MRLRRITPEQGKQEVKLSIVVPCFNEEAVLPVTAQRLDGLLQALRMKGKIGSGAVLFVDDGSVDATWRLIEELSITYSSIQGIRLSRNRGHQNALLAGIFHADGDAVVTIDADLQDDESVIEQMVDLCKQGFDMVFGVRIDRSADSPFKRISAISYYRMLSAMGVEVIHNHADFRLMTRTAVRALQDYEEVNLYLRGIIPLLGFRTATIPYTRVKRFAGESKYPLSKMISLSFEGVMSFSALPLRMISLLGLTISVFALGMAMWALFIKFATSQALPGWASTVVPLYFLGGLQLLSLGVIGEYLGKTYMETKRRPRYIIDKTTCAKSQPATELVDKFDHAAAVDQSPP
jgi:glycosyltransferase involved in cell wall biosynthesis